jgi:putative transposase
MPFASKSLHEYWSADIRYIDTPRLSPGGQIYVISVLENHSRAILASGVYRTQNLSSFMSVFYQAVERYSSPDALVTDSGPVFRANRAKAVYEALGMEHEQIERGQPWQNFAETTLTVPMECPSMTSSLHQNVSAVRRAARDHRRRESARSSDGDRWRACRCI